MISLVTEILQPLAPYLKSLTLIPADGGVFDVRVDGETVYSKLFEEGRFPGAKAIIKLVRERA